LLIVIPVTSEDVRAEYETLMGELEAFSDDLATKPKMVVLSKLDLIPPEDRDEWLGVLRSAFRQTSMFSGSVRCPGGTRRT
jgi:GTPase